jgi:hypothetical protein
MAAKTRPCERCGKEIPAERVEVLPDTRLCLECSQAVGGEFDVMITPENCVRSANRRVVQRGWREPLGV